MKNRIENYKGYVISEEEGTEKGVFFRSPLQKVCFDAYGYETTFSAWEYMNAIKKPLRKFYEILIGNGNIVKNVQKWSEDSDFCGFNANILCCPIYFKREYRKLAAYSCRYGDIREIDSYGYESEFNICAGECDMEKTVIHLRNGKTIRIKRKNQYHFTYEHIIKKIIDTDIIEND